MTQFLRLTVYMWKALLQMLYFLVNFCLDQIHQIKVCAFVLYFLYGKNTQKENVGM